MTQLQYDTTPDQCKVYPIFADDDFTTLENAEVNSNAWIAGIGEAGEIAFVTDPDGHTYTTFEELKELGIESFKLVCEHEVSVSDYL